MSSTALAAEHAPAPTIVECPDCGLRHSPGALPRGAVARCRRCGAVLGRGSVAPLDYPLALAIAGLVLLALANLMPFLSLRIEGRVQDASLATGAIALAQQGLWLLAAVVTSTSLAAPAVKLGGLCYVLGGLRLRRPPRHLPAVFRWLDKLHPWAMVEVYLLGAFVAYVKLAGIATVQVGVALYSLAAVMVVMAAGDMLLDSRAVWRAMERRGLVPRLRAAPQPGLARCDGCALVSPAAAHDGRCPRCGGALHRRKPDSLSRTWALVLAAAILYIPANFYPIMTVISFGTGSPDTILSGIRRLFEAGMWPLALLVFFASITVPVLKIVSLVALLLATQRKSAWRLRDRTVLYRIVEAVGRWSMIDIFMVSILVALVRLGAIASVSPGVGSLSFAAVVIITMLAAMTFDPRLMWDAAGENS
jgi:paraquat-inducible protein A